MSEKKRLPFAGYVFERFRVLFASRSLDFFFLVLADRSDVFLPVWSSGVAIFQSSWVQLIEPRQQNLQDKAVLIYAEYFGGLLPASIGVFGY